MRLLPRLLPVLLAPLLVRWSSAQEPPAAPTPAPKVVGVDVTFLANSGFFLESGRYSVLIDAFLREPSDIFAGLPEQVYKQLVNAQPPFDDLTIVLVSHDHPDHVQMRGLEKYLGKNAMSVLWASPEVVQSLQAHARDFGTIQRRIRPIPTAKNAIQEIVHEEMSIGFMQLEHRGKPGEEILNLGHLIEMGGVKILHVGDAMPTVENFAPYGFAKMGIDVAIVPYWFFNQAKGVRVLQEEIKPKTVVVCHVPPSEQEKFQELLKAQFPDVILFTEALEKRTFRPSTAPPPEKEPGQGG
jgi:L-ascorbate metabolism protein UlaG (beta-lactamase superfamily)